MGTKDVIRRIRRLRKLSGLGVSPFGLYAGLSAETLRVIELSLNQDRQINPSLETISAVCKATGADGSWVLFGQGDPPDRDTVRASIEKSRREYKRKLEQSRTGDEDAA